MRPTVLTALLALSLTACDKLPTRPKTAFNADSAWSYTQQQVNFGPETTYEITKPSFWGHRPPS